MILRQGAGISDGQKLSPEGDALLGAVKVSLPYDGQRCVGKLCQSPTLERFSGFIGGTDRLANRAGQLRWEAKFSELSIVGLGQPIRVQLFGLENDLGKPVRGFLPDSKQSVSLGAAGNLELCNSDCFHPGQGYCRSEAVSIEFRKNNHSLSRLLVHLVFVVKYRRAAISDEVWENLCRGFEFSANRLDLTLVELNHDKDHAHLVVEYSPKVSISELANSLKGNGSIVARRNCSAALHKTLWGSAFWSPSFLLRLAEGLHLSFSKPMQCRNKLNPP